MFERTMNSKKSTLQQIAERAFSIHQRNQKHGEYASYFFLMKVIDKMEIPSLQVLKNILNEKIEKREKCWILEMVGKYSFELMQKILHQ